MSFATCLCGSSNLIQDYKMEVDGNLDSYIGVFVRLILLLLRAVSGRADGSHGG